MIDRNSFKDYRLAFYGIILIGIALIPKISISDEEDDWFGVTGLYHYSYPGVNNRIINSYLVINKNSEQYMVISISKDLQFLGALLLVETSEVLENSIFPSLEEFAVSFTAPKGEIIYGKKYYIEPVIPFPDRTTKMKWVEADRWIAIGPPRNGGLSVCVSTRMEIAFHPTICYKKIF